MRLFSILAAATLLWMNSAHSVEMPREPDWFASAPTQETFGKAAESSLSSEFRKSTIKGKKPIVVRHTSLRVFLDPGHGGKDDGAVGLEGIQEKKLSLDLSKRVRRHLIRKARGKLDLEIRLSRDGDLTLPLGSRVDMANEWEADLFVSIHANSSPVMKARGFEVYFMSPNASDSRAKELARKENSSDPQSIPDQVQWILNDVQTNFHIRESSRFAEAMFRKISESLHANGRGVRQAPFTVLAGTEMPALLLEVGYLTNPHEARLLTKDLYLNRMADAISSGLIEFLIRQRAGRIS